MFHPMRSKSFRSSVFLYIIFSLVFMGWPVICYCEDGHFENAYSVVGCFDDTKVNLNCPDDSLFLYDNHRIDSGDSCRDVLISIRAFWNQPLSAGSFAQKGKTNFSVYLPFTVLLPGSNLEKNVATGSDRRNRIHSTLQSVRLLI